METSALKFQLCFCIHASFSGGRLGFLHSLFFQRVSCGPGRTFRVTVGVHDKRHLQSPKGPLLTRAQLQTSPSSFFPQALSITCVYDLSPSPQLHLAPSVPGCRLQKNTPLLSKRRNVGLTPKGYFSAPWSCLRLCNTNSYV